MKKIYGNTIINCGGGIKVGGNDNTEISKNRIYNTHTGIEVDHDFEGTIAENDIQDSNQAILVNQMNPFHYFNIPSNISKADLYTLFQQLDANEVTDHPNIAKESILSQVDQFTSILERIINFSKEYGPILITTFGPYLS